jgi:hypothetical protein
MPTPLPLQQAAACLVFAIGVAACGGNASDVAAFADACQQSTNLGQAVCTCMAEKARTELPEDSRTFLLATLREDETAATKARSRLNLEEAMRAGMFMTKVTSCVSGPTTDSTE